MIWLSRRYPIEPFLFYQLIVKEEIDENKESMVCYRSLIRFRTYAIKKLLIENYGLFGTSRWVQSLVGKLGEVTDNFLPLEMDLTNDKNHKVLQSTLDCICNG